MKELLSTKDLHIGFNDHRTGLNTLHSNINVVLNEAEFACVLGPNGAGKSTLIKTLTGFLKPIKGSVYINQLNLTDYNKKILSKTISIVFTERLKVPEMTVLEMVSLGRSPYTDFLGRLKQTDKQHIFDSIRDLNIEHLKHRYLTTLSDGELQKVMIAKALSQDTPIIVLDEPTAFLDLPSKVDIMQQIRQLARNRGKGILLSTHDLDLALNMADKIWLLDKGKELTTGTPEDLILNNDFRKFFEKDGVIFDNERGIFKVNQDNIKTIRLIGQGIEFKWVQRALTRSGYDTTTIKGNYPKIEVLSNGKREFLLTHTSGESNQFRTIEDLLSEIKKVL